jgi:hypothetical protein
MVHPNFDYEGAKSAGYTDEEIQQFLGSHPSYKKTNTNSAWQNIKNNALNFVGNFGNPTQKEAKESNPLESIDQRLLKNVPNFDVKEALSSGYTSKEINEFLEENQPKRNILEKGSRIAGQFGLGLAENALLPYELGVAPLSSKESMNVPYREDLGEELENLLIQKQSGQWSPQDEQFLQHIQQQLQDPRKSMEYVETLDVGVRDLAEKATGLNTHPEGTLEKAANWVGFLKNPKNISQLAKKGIKLSDIYKGIAPTGKQALSGLGAGIALQAAEEGNFGPIGTMAAAVVGDVAGELVGHGLSGGVKGISKLVTNPKKTLAELAVSFTPKEKKQLQQSIIKDFRNSGLQADLGTITDSNLIKWTQSRLAQSGLTGKALEDFRNELTDQIKREYGRLADELGNSKFITSYEAGEVLKQELNKIRETDLGEARSFYKRASQFLKDDSYTDSRKVSHLIERIESNLKPGSIKSSEQQTVLHALDSIKRDVFDSSGKPIFARVKDIINDKIALNDIINYEVQGGTKQLLKEIVGEIDRAIISHGKENPSFAKNYILANKKFSEHAKTFRNKDISSLLKTENPSQMLNRMNSIHGIRNLNRILSKTPEGREIFRKLKRMKLDDVIGNNLTDSTTQQVRLGTFSKLLQKGKNRELIKEILSRQAFNRLERLQKNAGRLADASDKFYNASKSGVVAADAAVLGKAMSDIAYILQGNPWPLLKTTAGVMATRKLAHLLSDPTFLKLVEEAMLSAEKSSQKSGQRELILSIERLKPYLAQLRENLEEPQEND